MAGNTVLLEGLDQLLQTLSLPTEVLLQDARLQRELFLQRAGRSRVTRDRV